MGIYLDEKNDSLSGMDFLIPMSQLILQLSIKKLLINLIIYGIIQLFNKINTVILLSFYSGHLGVLGVVEAVVT